MPQKDHDPSRAVRPIGAALACLALCCGCSQLPEARLQDTGRINTLRVGMEKKFALRILGTELMTVRDPEGNIRQIVPNPYETRYLAVAGKDYEIVLYFTNPRRRSGPIAKDEITPFVFESDRLIGWGWEFADRLEKAP